MKYTGLLCVCVLLTYSVSAQTVQETVTIDLPACELSGGDLHATPRTCVQLCPGDRAPYVDNFEVAVTGTTGATTYDADASWLLIMREPTFECKCANDKPSLVNHDTWEDSDPRNRLPIVSTAESWMDVTRYTGECGADATTIPVLNRDAATASPRSRPTRCTVGEPASMRVLDFSGTNFDEQRDSYLCPSSPQCPSGYIFVATTKRCANRSEIGAQSTTALSPPLNHEVVDSLEVAQFTLSSAEYECDGTSVTSGATCTQRHTIPAYDRVLDALPSTHTPDCRSPIVAGCSKDYGTPTAHAKWTVLKPMARSPIVVRVPA